MIKAKIHPIKEIAARLKAHQNVLLIGPLPIREALLRNTVKSIRPTLILFVDGGQKHRKKLLKIWPFQEISLGDGDSGSLNPDYLLPTEKDFSDLAFAFDCLKKSRAQLKKIGLLGFSGDKDHRRDHFLVNIGETENFVRKIKVPVCMDGSIHFYPAGLHQFKWKGLFSVMTLRKNAIRISGKACYKLAEWTTLQPLSSLGLSNSGAGMIQLESKASVLVYFAGEKIS